MAVRSPQINIYDNIAKKFSMVFVIKYYTPEHK